MAKTLLFIGGSVLQLPSIRWAQAAGLEVILTDKNPCAPGHKLVDCSYTMGGDDVDGLVSLALDLKAEGEFAGAYCSNDFGLEAVAAISEATETPGNTLSAVRRCLDKSAATTTWRKMGINTPKGACVASEAELRATLETLGLPAIVKPLSSSGSRGVRSIWKVKEISAAYREARHHAGDCGSVLVEKYIEGQHIDVNGFFVEGEFERGGILDRFFTPAPQHVPTWGCQPSHLDAKEKNRVYRLVERAARAVGIESGPVKADVIFTEEGPVILELGPRFHGDVSSSYVTPRCSDFGPIASWFDALADPDDWRCPDLDGKQEMSGWMALFPEQPGFFQEIKGLDKLVKTCGIEEALLLKPKNHLISQLGDNTSVCGFVFATGASQKEIKAKLDAARKAVTVVVSSARELEPAH
jgi:biotin carboxylase